MLVYGPKTKNEETEELEQIAIVEAFEEAEEYLSTGFYDDDFSFIPED